MFTRADNIHRETVTQALNYSGQQHVTNIEHQQEDEAHRVVHAPVSLGRVRYLISSTKDFQANQHFICQLKRDRDLAVDMKNALSQFQLQSGFSTFLVKHPHMSVPCLETG